MNNLLLGCKWGLLIGARSKAEDIRAEKWFTEKMETTETIP